MLFKLNLATYKSKSSYSAKISFYIYRYPKQLEKYYTLHNYKAKFKK